jgi:O-antigen ligase
MAFFKRLFPDSRFPLEFLLLLCLAFFLPLYEAPKNVFWLLWIGTWAFNRSRARDWGGAWDGWDTVIATWIASVYVVAFFAGVHDKEWGGAHDILRNGLVLWLVRRSRYSRGEMAWLAAVLLGSCAIGVAWGFGKLAAAGKFSYLQLHSVGHSNHTAPYVAIAAGFALAVLCFAWEKLGRGGRGIGMLITLFLFVGLLATTSRAAVGAFLVVPPLLALAVWRRSRKRALFAMAGFLSALLITVVVDRVLVDIDIVQKHRQFAASDDPSNGRLSIWRRAWVAWEVFPLFGVGVDNYGKIPEDRIRARVESTGEIYDAQRYRGPNHAHSLYLNTLAERGLVGFVAFAALFAAWVTTLWRRRPQPAVDGLTAAYWGGATGALAIIVVVGVANTSFHHEIAMLAVMLLGGWMNLDRTRADG